MILREFLSYQSIRGEFLLLRTRLCVCCVNFVRIIRFFFRVLRVYVLTLLRTVSCACGEHDGYHGRYANT